MQRLLLFEDNCEYLRDESTRTNGSIYQKVLIMTNILVFIQVWICKLYRCRFVFVYLIPEMIRLEHAGPLVSCRYHLLSVEDRQE